MSTYLDTSAISQINNKDLFEWTKVSENFKFVLSFAVTLCKENNLPIIVFNIKDNQNITNLIDAKHVGTLVS